MKVAVFFVNIKTCCPFRFAVQISDISFAFTSVSKAGCQEGKKNTILIEMNFAALHRSLIIEIRQKFFFERFCCVVAAIFPGDCYKEHAKIVSLSVQRG